MRTSQFVADVFACLSSGVEAPKRHLGKNIRCMNLNTLIYILPHPSVWVKNIFPPYHCVHPCIKPNTHKIS